MAKFLGGSYYAVDDKGRVVIPLRFRSLLGERFMITRGFGGCLFIFSDGQWRQLEEKFDEGPLFNQKKIRLQRFLFGQAAELTPDTQGRVAIPQELREWAKIDMNSEVQIIGNANWVEVWSRKNYEAMLASEQANEEELLNIADEYLG